MPAADVTFILATHNRRDVLIKTLQQLDRLSSSSFASETIVVDNASTDGTPAAVEKQFPRARALALRVNLGSCAKSLAVDRARGQFIVFLDDDSFPRPESVERMIEHFRRDERLGAAGFAIHLPTGARECSAFPNVFVGCGVGFRADALRAVGGLDAGFFMQAEEFDLSFRFVAAGWRVKTFDDLHVDHLKTPQARVTARTAFYDTRNNLIVVDRYLPDRYRSIYRKDWSERYRWLAAINGHTKSYWRGRIAARLRCGREHQAFADHRLTPTAFEKLFRLEEIEARTAALRRSGIRRVVLADLGKNVYAFHRAARQSDLAIAAIADDRFAGRRYRGVQIVPVSGIPALKPEAIVVSNTATVHAETTRQRVAQITDVPCHCWYRTPAASAGHNPLSFKPHHVDVSEPLDSPIAVSSAAASISTNP